MTRSLHHRIDHKKLRQMELAAVSRECCANESLTGQVAAAAAASVTRLSGKSVNAQNALMRIEAKMKTRTSHSMSHDDDDDDDDDGAAVNATTVFVGNVALSVTKKVTHVSVLCYIGRTFTRVRVK